MANINKMEKSNVKLFIRIVDGPYGKAAVLVDQDGAVLDGQVSVETFNAVDELTRAKVLFNVDWWSEK